MKIAILSSGPSVIDSWNQANKDSFTPTGSKPILLILHLRSVSDVDQPLVSCTIGSAGRPIGTGTALTFLDRRRNSRANVYAYYLESPSASSQTIQAEFTSAGNGCEIRAYEINDAGTVGATSNNAATAATSIASSITTTAYGSHVVHAATILNNSLFASTQTEIYDIQPNAATSVSGAVQDATSIGSYSNTFSWTGAIEAVSVVVELTPA